MELFKYKVHHSVIVKLFSPALTSPGGWITHPVLFLFVFVFSVGSPPGPLFPPLRVCVCACVCSFMRASLWPSSGQKVFPTLKPATPVFHQDSPAATEYPRFKFILVISDYATRHPEAYPFEIG